MIYMVGAEGGANVKDQREDQTFPGRTVRGRARRAMMDLPAAITWSLILVVAGAVAVLVWRPFGKEAEPTSFTPPTFQPTVSTVPPGVLGTKPSTITNPQPWQYDPATDQHWHPQHNHWHSGPPPNQNTAGTNALTSAQPPGFTLSSSGTTQPGVTAAAWEYDAENDQYWHPGHNHWHPGLPPANPPTTTAPGTPLPGTIGGEIPAPWYHDTANDRHWNPDPGHNHWHPGPPPGNPTTTTAPATPAPGG